MERDALRKSITVLIIILSVSTALMIYLSNIQATAFDKELYSEKFVEYDVYAGFKIGTNLTAHASELIDYLKSGEGEIESSFYNQKEKTHLVEVRQLFRAVSVLLNVAVLLSVVSMFFLLVAVKRYAAGMKREYLPAHLKKTLSRILIITGATVDGVAVLFMLMAAFFSTAFYWFHQIFFRTDTWMLDPATDNLIRMFPEPFFFDLFIRILLASVIFATVMLVIGFLIRLGKPRWIKRD